jgi:hypothetical protein
MDHIGQSGRLRIQPIDARRFATIVPSNHKSRSRMWLTRSNAKALSFVIFGLACLLHFTASFASPINPVWLTSACFNIPMNAWDKLSLNPSYRVTYIVEDAGGRTYVATKQGTANNVEASSVSFPGDFTERRTGLPADADCNRGRDYRWTIFVNDRLIDSGSFSFKRSLGKKP